jgi:hypothetical protein
MSLTQTRARQALTDLVNHNTRNPPKDITAFLKEREIATIWAFVGESSKWSPIDVVECLASGTLPELPTPPDYTMKQFDLALAFWAGEHKNHYTARKAAMRAFFAAMWFIENVTQEDPARNDIYFKVRELARQAQ